MSFIFIKVIYDIIFLTQWHWPIKTAVAYAVNNYQLNILNYEEEAFIKFLKASMVLFIYSRIYE